VIFSAQPAADSSAAETNTKPLLSIRSIAKRFGSTTVLRDVSLDVAPGELLTVLGESGSGKTTLLRLIAGFEQPDGGEIYMAGERLDRLPPYRRRVNTVFQHYALFPHLSVFENVAYGLRVRRVERREIPKRVQQALALVKMIEFSGRAPAQLSGGQQQRIALARALVNQPKLLLLDEPLSALDANLRRQMQLELKSLQREVGISFVFVTHDQEEAMALSDRIALLRSGQLEQVAAPREIYNRPATAYTARFVGQTNLLNGRVSNSLAQCGTLQWRCGAPDGAAIFSLRPENIRLREPSTAANRDSVCFRAVIRTQTFGGPTDLLEITCPDGQVLRVRIASRGNLAGEYDFEFAAGAAILVKD
jgi:ABC-type Fe3+/spermidine/putrescine transport system ATPase subunit